MKLKLVLSAIILAANPAFAFSECPNISGHWTGTCRAETKGSSEALASVQPLLERQEKVLEIKMLPASHPLACRLITVGDHVLVVGGQNEQRLIIPYDGAKTVTVSYTDSGVWNLSEKTLTSSATGKVEVEGTVVPFEVRSRLELHADGHLYRMDESKGQGFDIHVNCDYQRQS